MTKTSFGVFASLLKGKGWDSMFDEEAKAISAVIKVASKDLAFASLFD
jgi:hypothetical protein